MRRLIPWVIVGLLGCSSPSRESTASLAPADESPPLTEAADASLPHDFSTAPIRISTLRPGETLLSAPEAFDEFWTPPATIPGTPGNVIWATEARLVFGGETRRILYNSRDTHGAAVGVTAWLGVPRDLHENSPIISWGHGTTGMADDCAPTRKDSVTAIPFLQALLDNGYIVVATDYAYLGTPGPHPYYDASTMAASMVDAAVAAQQFTGSEGPVIFAGYSIGGRGAIFAQDLSRTYAPELNVRGTAALRPGVDGIAEGGTLWRTLRDSPLKGYVVMAFYGVSLAWGDTYYELDDILTPRAIELLPRLDEDCLDSVIEAFAEIPGDQVFKVGIDDPLPTGVEGVAEQVTSLPLLVIAGRSDTSAAPPVIESYFDKACANGQPIELHWLNIGHDLSPDFDEPLFLDWLDSVVADEPGTDSCRTGPIQPRPCRDSEKCFRVGTAEVVEGLVENPFAGVTGLEWNLVHESTHGYACPVYGTPCRENRTEGHISRIWRATIPVDASNVESWVDEVYGRDIDPAWQFRIYDEEPRPGWPCGFYFQFLRYNNWGFATIMPGDVTSEMYVFVTHQNRTTQPPMSDIPWGRYWPC
jgi:hypothetical protein